jgi:hypothetical protein
MKKIIIIYKLAKRNFIRKILQNLADKTYQALKETNNQYEFDYYLKLAASINGYAILYNIHLK